MTNPNTLTDLDRALCVACLRIVATEDLTEPKQREALLELAERLQASEPSSRLGADLSCLNRANPAVREVIEQP